MGPRIRTLTPLTPTISFHLYAHTQVHTHTHTYRRGRGSVPLCPQTAICIASFRVFLEMQRNWKTEPSVYLKTKLWTEKTTKLGNYRDWSTNCILLWCGGIILVKGGGAETPGWQKEGSRERSRMAQRGESETMGGRSATQLNRLEPLHVGV